MKILNTKEAVPCEEILQLLNPYFDLSPTEVVTAFELAAPSTGLLRYTISVFCTESNQLEMREGYMVRHKGTK